MNRLIPWALVALLSFILGGASSTGVSNWLRQHQASSASAPSTVPVRDSARISMDTARARHEVRIKWLTQAPADTLGPILRALARRPPLIKRDTLYLPLDTGTAGDTGTLEPCDISVSCQEARRLLARDTSRSLLADSARWEDRIKAIRIDSLESRLSTCLVEKSAAYGRGFLYGAGAGFVTCKSVEAIISFFF